MSEWIMLAGQFGLSLLGGGAVAWAFRWRAARAAVDVEAERTKRHAANNAAQLKLSEAEEKVARLNAEAEDARQVPTLVQKIEQLWEQRDDCKQTLAREREARTKERAADREACDKEVARAVEERTAPLREQLATIAKLQRRSLHDEITDVHHLDEIIAANTTPPASTPHERGEES